MPPCSITTTRQQLVSSETNQQHQRDAQREQRRGKNQPPHLASRTGGFLRQRWFFGFNRRADRIGHPPWGVDDETVGASTAVIARLQHGATNRDAIQSNHVTGGYAFGVQQQA